MEGGSYLMIRAGRFSWCGRMRMSILQIHVSPYVVAGASPSALGGSAAPWVGDELPQPPCINGQVTLLLCASLRPSTTLMQDEHTTCGNAEEKSRV